MRSSLATSILFLTAACSAQMPTATTVPVSSSPEPNGVVTGRVFCGDTGRPARFASVSLMPVPDPVKAKLDKANLGSTSKPAPGTSTVSIAVDTALDGNYTLTHVAPGTYYVIVKKDGYITPLTMFSKKQLDEPTDQIRALIEEALPRVQVEQDSIAHADVQLQRGAAVSGSISYDDGTPASGISVTLLRRDENGKWVQVGGSRRINPPFSQTNDRGYFRIASLLPDTYLLEATLNLSDETTRTTSDSAGHTMESMMKSFRFSLEFYGEGSPHIEQATGFTLRGSDERTGQDMTLPISKLHKLTGRVVTGSNGHRINAASVELLYASEGSGKTTIARTNIEREDGLYHFEFVPEGDYTLRVTNARDVTWEPADPPQPGTTMPGGFPPPDKEHVLETYGDVDMPLLLRGDMTDVIATVPAKRTNQSAAR
ncbi:MAG TPA: hypothetical protein VF214_00335 [Edaphobacter sp.]